MSGGDVAAFLFFAAAALFGVHKAFAFGSAIGSGLGKTVDTSGAYQIIVRPQNSEAVDLLARTIWGEARGDGYRGMQAVANVVMNRIYRSGWPDTVRGVTLQSAQFSAWNAGDPNRPLMEAVTAYDASFQDALKIAQLAIDGMLSDITGGADHYHANTIAAPYWADGGRISARIGNHIFYNLTGGQA